MYGTRIRHVKNFGLMFIVRQEYPKIHLLNDINFSGTLSHAPLKISKQAQVYLQF